MKIIYYLLITLLLVSCHDEYSICEEPTEVRLHAGFYSTSSGNEQPASASNFTLSLLGSSSPIYNQQQNISKFLITLNPTLASAQYEVTIQPNITDTVTLSYTTQKVTISEICPEIYIYQLHAASSTTHFLRSIQVINPVVNTSIMEHVKLYF